MRTTYTLIAMCALTFICNSVDAAIFCVSTSAQLTSALDTAENNGQNDEIRVQSGLYSATSGSTAFVYSSGESFSLDIKGGYMASCSGQIPRANETILTGSAVRKVMAIGSDITAVSLLRISNLTIRHGFSNTNGAGLSISSAAENALGITVERVIFENNISNATGGALRVFSDGGLVQVRGNLFFRNQSAANAAAGIMTINYSDNVTDRLIFRDNTVVNNTCTPAAPISCTIGGVFHGGNGHAKYINNIFASNDGTDLSLQGGSNVELSHNNILNLAGAALSNTNAFTLVDPLFVDPAQDNYRLQIDSPLRNAGPSTLGFAAIDLDGETRLHESALDVGAYENHDIILSNGFE
jgi:hypothetical protein